MLGWHEVSGFTQTCCRKHHVLVLIYLFLSTLTQCPDLFLKISSGVTLRNVETYNRGSLYIRYFVTKPSPHTDSKMSSSILSHGEETHHRNTQYPQTEQSFSCSVSSLSVTSFPIFRWCCRDAVGIERQSDSLFCAGPFESTPPSLLINSAAVCKSEKGGCHRETRTGHLSISSKQSSYQCDGCKNGSSSGKLNLRRWFWGEQATYDPSKTAYLLGFKCFPKYPPH